MENQSLFRVNIKGDEKTHKRCHLKGVYNIAVKDTSLCLCDVKSNRVIYEWPYIHIRNYGKSRTHFTFEAGRKSLSGEGVFNMETAEGSSIVNMMMEKTQRIKAARGCKQGPANGINKGDTEAITQTSEEGGVHLYVNTDTTRHENEGLYDCID
ncbi:docking protein 2-like [Haliotis rufescens]|uniref:docking protein 2-like n=1 Tax=Haliotis rufescens TaxID=6454 RepID=UPI001EAFF91D|nr:docking protein 2-like [Haliotis rufescens]